MEKPKMIEIEIPGKPIAKKRPKFARRGKFVQTYNPQESEEGMWLCKAMKDIGTMKPLEGPIRLEVIFFMPMPSSASNKKKDQMLTNEIKHIKKPDIDNLEKFLMDCLNGVVWKDDAQVVEKTSKKLYSDSPSTFFRIIDLS